MLFAEIIVKNLRHRLTRTALTVVGLAVAVTAITTLWSIAWGYANSANSFYSARGVDIVVVRAGVSNRLTSSMRAEIALRVASLLDVAGVDGSLTEMVSLGESHLIGIPLRGLALDGFTIGQLPVSQGQSLQPGDRGSVLLGSGIAADLGKRNGQQIEIEGTKFRIAGVFQPSNPFDSNSIVASLGDVQALMGRDGAISELQVRAVASHRNEEFLKKLCRAIEELRDDQQQPLGLKAQLTNQFVDSATESRLGTAMAWATTAIVLTLSLIGMLNSMLMSVIERTRELGILRALGWRRTRIMRLIVGESLIISLAGAIIGSIASWLLLQALTHWSKTSLLVPSNLSSAAITLGICAAIVAGVVGSLIPAFLASNAPPVESLRYE